MNTFEAQPGASQLGVTTLQVFVEHHQGKQQRQIKDSSLQEMTRPLFRARRVRRQVEHSQSQADIKQAQAQKQRPYEVKPARHAQKPRQKANRNQRQRIE